MTLQLLRALEYIHSKGVVHRDLKLSNILITEAIINDGKHLSKRIFVKICDFGLAVRILHPDEEHFTLCGTPNYIAPEIAAQRSSHGYPADLWSIGCLFYSMMVGEPPFEQENIPQTLQAIMAGEFEIPKGVFSETAIDFLRSLLTLVSNKYLTIY